MRSEVIVNRSHSRALLMFCGWGTDASVATMLNFSGYDTIAIWDYRTVSDFDTSLLLRYDEIVVAAWSFGVAAAARFLADNPALSVTRRVAINGTLHPVSDTLGIPEAIFRGTLDGLSERSLLKFYRRMSDGRPFSVPGRSIDELADELRAIEKLEIPTDSKWDIAFISDNDRIIPADNQTRAWQGTPVRHISGGHLPDFRSILSPLLIDKDLVARRFGGATTTYNSAATVQRHIAKRLIELTEVDPSVTIEIGSGTGLLTKLFLERYCHGQFTLVDFNPTPTPGAKTVAADAELWIASEPDESATCIISSSTMQWFNSPLRFIDNVKRVLRPGGVALLSTFGQTNMRELDGLAPRLHYAAINELPHIVDSEEIQLEFDTPMDALRHMRMTGVNALSGTSADALRLARHWPRNEYGRFTLTYNPVYLLIRK